MTTATAPKQNLNELARILGCKPAFVAARCKYLGLVVVPCGRCGGSGRYSYNQMDGDRCYGCQGAQVRLPAKITAKHVAEVQAAVAGGRLQVYIQGLVARKQVKGAVDQMLKVWGETRVGKANHHIFGARHVQERNHFMHETYDAARQVAFYIETNPDDLETARAFMAELPNTLATLKALDITQIEFELAMAEQAERRAAHRALCEAEAARTGRRVSYW
jgi:hypothetical protein